MRRTAASVVLGVAVAACSSPTANAACETLRKEIGGNAACSARTPDGDFAMAKDSAQFWTHKTSAPVLVFEFATTDELQRARERPYAGSSVLAGKKILIFVSEKASSEELEAVKRHVGDW